MGFGRSGRHGGLIVALEKFRLGLRGWDMAEGFQQQAVCHKCGRHLGKSLKAAGI